jgi:glutamate-ammonia-ligase adenylyltransferase
MPASANASSRSAKRCCARSARPSCPLKQEVLAMRKRMVDAKPNHTELFDLKQDPGGMIDIEFIVQFLVLQHAAAWPQLTANVGNIALLKLCGELGLINVGLASSVGDAYRKLRKLQHQLRLQGQDLARVDSALVAGEAAQVSTLWHSIFGESVAS